MSDQQIFEQAARQAEADAIEYFGADLIGSKEQRLKLSLFDQQILVNWLLKRGAKHVHQLMPKVVSVSFKGVQLQKI